MSRYRRGQVPTREIRLSREAQAWSETKILCIAKLLVIESRLCSRVSGVIWFMPAARWRRLERSRSCVSCRWESAWRRSSRFRTAREYSKMPPPGVNTEGLVEVVTTPLGSREADDAWSYPDFVDLRDADTGMVMTGWAMRSRARSPSRLQAERRRKSSTMFVSANYFRDDRRGAGAGTGIRRDDGWRVDGGARRDSGIQILAEPAGLRSGHRREDADPGWHPACRGRHRTGSI